MPPAQLSFDAGPLHVQVDGATGRIAISGPDRAGVADASVITIHPPTARVNGATLALGKALAALPQADGLQLTLAFGPGPADVRLSTPDPWTDYYSFTAAANDTVSVALKHATGRGANIGHVSSAARHRIE